VFFLGVTSGTTKEPKLVMLTHTNFISGQVCQKFFGFDMNEKDCYYSYAPLSHVFE
jgi:long-subunit acyl-CoA synthetase (AMP-forming)